MQYFFVHWEERSGGSWKDIYIHPHTSFVRDSDLKTVS